MNIILNYMLNEVIFIRYSRLTQSQELYNGYSKIRPKDLLNGEIRSNDLKYVELSASSLRKKFIKHFFVSLFFVVIIAALIISDIIDGSQYSFNEAVIVVITFLSFCLLSLYLLRQVMSVKNYSSKKCQYGTVITKFQRKKRVDNKIKYDYYVNVIFNDTFTFIENVNCEEEVFHLIQKNSPVLVITFDNKNAYAFNIDETQ